MVAKLEPERALRECRKYAESGDDSEGSQGPDGQMNSPTEKSPRHARPQVEE